MNITQLLNQGKQEMSRLNFQKARQSFERALTVDSRSVDAMVGLARLSLLKNDLQGGSAQLDVALHIQPNNAEALALQGVSFLLQEDYPQAIQLLEEARNQNPELKMVYTNLARAYRNAGLLDQSEDAAGIAIGKDPKNFQAYAEWSAVLAEKRKFKEAARALRKALEINPLFTKAYVALGRLLTASGRGERAIDLYRRGLKVNPNAHILRGLLCDLYALKMDFRSAYSEAAELAVRRNNYRDYLRLGSYALALGLFEKAEKAFKKSIEINSRSWEGHFNLGELYNAAELTKEAREQYQQALEKGANEFKPYIGMGLLVLKKDEKPEEAKDYFLRAMELAPERPEPAANLALACAMLSEYRSAESFAKTAMKLADEETPAYQETARLLRFLAANTT